MKPLDLHSEEFGATGNIAALGACNQLGRPKMDRLSLLIRETVQNSWDARLSNEKDVRYGIYGWTLNSEQYNFLRNTILKDVPNALDLHSFRKNSKSCTMLAIADRNTKGLGGPTRANEARAHKSSQDFVNLLRNIGQPSKRQFSGGTYGYGRAALYLYSLAKTIFVHTHCNYHGPRQRFMAAAMGNDFSKDGILYTGRHWWGRQSVVDRVADPVEGDNADIIAASIGAPLFKPGETGTTIILLQPDFNDRTPEQAFSFMVENILWFFWPKMLLMENDRPYIHFSLKLNNREIDLPDPSAFPPIAGYISAMKKLKEMRRDNCSDDGKRFRIIECRRPHRKLGYLSFNLFPRKHRVEYDSHSEGENTLIPPVSHHIALMRKPELVVTYLPGPALPSELMEYAGVFVSEDSLDHIFAKAEPPTHDSWTPDTMDVRKEKTFVRVALKRIKEAADVFASPLCPALEGSGEYSLGAFSEHMAGLIPCEEGPGISPDPGTGGSGSGGGSSGRKRAKVILLSEGRLELIDKRPALTLQFNISHASDSSKTKVILEAGIAVYDSGTLEKEPPFGADLPTVLFWKDRSGNCISTDMSADIESIDDGPWSVSVSVPQHSAVSINLKAATL